MTTKSKKEIIDPTQPREPEPESSEGVLSRMNPDLRTHEPISLAETTELQELLPVCLLPSGDLDRAAPAESLRRFQYLSRRSHQFSEGELMRRVKDLESQGFTYLGSTARTWKQKLISAASGGRETERTMTDTVYAFSRDSSENILLYSPEHKRELWTRIPRTEVFIMDSSGKIDCRGARFAESFLQTLKK